MWKTIFIEGFPAKQTERKSPHFFLPSFNDLDYFDKNIKMLETVHDKYHVRDNFDI